MSMRATLRTALAAAVLLALAGCSLFAPKLEKPRLSIVGVEMQKGDLFEQRLKVRMRVQNPNDRALPVKGLSYQLLVANEPLASGMSSASFQVPALGEAEFDMSVTANVMGVVAKLASRKDGPKLSDELPYQLVGKVELSGGFVRTIPFHDSGSIRFVIGRSSFPGQGFLSIRDATGTGFGAAPARLNPATLDGSS